MKVALDANCFIDACRPCSPAYSAMQLILAAWKGGNVKVLVSRHTLSELAQKPDQAYDLARQSGVLPHYPLGTWDEQVACWDDLAGTWNDAKRKEAIQQKLQELAKSGNDIRDRGPYIDALAAGVDAFVTSDKHLAASAAAERIEQRFALRIITPQALASELEQGLSGG